MSFELVYTSTRRGLREGASGFCTVAATDAIPRPLHEKLESLSGYSHKEVTTGAEPPVNHSHLTIRLLRTVYHVVSRIGDAGIDYTGRTNKIAHHLALTSAEVAQFSSGPASLFSDTEFWYPEWGSGPETLPGGRLPRVQPESVNDFDTWTSVFGDAGWAGILGQAAADGMKPVSIIVPPQEDTMSMLHEALQLVAPQSRWGIGFSTYFSRLAPGTQCHWRFILDGTSEARKLRARSPGILVDPLGSAGEPPDGNVFVEAAREGRASSVHGYGRSGPRSRTVPVRSPEGGAGRRRSGQQRRRSTTGNRRPERRQPGPRPQPLYEDVSLKRQRPRRKTGVWVVLVLFLAVIGILAYFGIQQL